MGKENVQTDVINLVNELDNKKKLNIGKYGTLKVLNDGKIILDNPVMINFKTKWLTADTAYNYIEKFVNDKYKPKTQLKTSNGTAIGKLRNKVKNG